MPDINYFWDEIEDNVVREYDENNNTIARYTTEPILYGSVLSQDRGGEKRYFQFDGLGNTTELTDALGDVTDTRRYTAFGKIAEQSGVTTFVHQWGGTYGYAHVVDALIAIRRRSFLATIGCWTSLDLRLDQHTPNRYCYADNSPLTMTDPSGLICMAQTILLKRNVTCDDDIDYSWTVTYRGKKGEFGFILQKVTFQYCAMSCTCDEAYVGLSWCKTKKRPMSSVVSGPNADEAFARCLHDRHQSEYWELWIVKDGKVLDRDYNPDATDTFSVETIGNAAGSTGIARHEGTLYFVPNQDTNDYPGGYDIWEVNVNSPAGKAIMTCENETVRMAVANIKPIGHRRVKKEWSCCPGSTIQRPKITPEISPECE